jgi:hypothetical protein
MTQTTRCESKTGEGAVAGRVAPRRWRARLCGAGLLAGLMAAPAAADPVIDTTDATLAAGAAATPGQVVVDAAAAAAYVPSVPRVEMTGSIGTFSTPMASAPRRFNGGHAFVASASKTLPAGDYEYASYTVQSGAVVTYQGPSTIRVAGDVVILGAVTTDAASAGALTFEAGGAATLASTASITVEAFDDLVFDTIGSFTAAAGAAILVRTGAVTIRTHGAPGATSDILLDGVVVDSSGALLQASGGVALSGGSVIRGVASDATLQAFGGDVTLSGGSSIGMTASWHGVRLEASGAVSLDGADSAIQATSADVRVRAFGGGLSLTDGAYVQLTTGTVDLAALGTLTVGQDSKITITVGTVRLKSFESDVVVSSSTGGFGTVTGNGVDVDASAGRDVVIDGAGAAVSITQGSMHLTAGRDVVNVAQSSWSVGGGGLVVLAGRSIAAPHLRVFAQSAVFGAETGAIGLADLGYDGSYVGAGFRAVSFDALTVGGSITAQGPIELASRSAAADVSGCAISTWGRAEADFVSSPVTIESFAGESGRVSAVGAHVATGAAQLGTSGDVRLLVHAGEIVPPPEEGFLVPVRATMRRLRAGGAVLTATGFLDTGSASLAAGAATLTIGDVAMPVTLADAGSNRLRATGDGYQLDLGIDPSGGSRATFQLRRTGDFTGFLTADHSGDLRIRVASGAATSSGTVALTKGAYPAGRAPRAARTADLYVARLQARLPGARRGTLDATIGIGSAAASVSSATSVRVSIGDRFSVDVPTSQFSERSGMLRATRPAPGVTSVVVDVRSGTIRVVSTDADLRTAAGDAPTPLVVGVSIGAQERRVLIRARVAGERISY